MEKINGISSSTGTRNDLYKRDSKGDNRQGKNGKKSKEDFKEILKAKMQSPRTDVAIISKEGMKKPTKEEQR